MGNGITNCYPDEVGKFISITVLSVSRCPSVGARPAVFSGQVDVFPAERRDVGQEFGRDRSRCRGAADAAAREPALRHDGAGGEDPGPSVPPAGLGSPARRAPEHAAATAGAPRKSRSAGCSGRWRPARGGARSGGGRSRSAAAGRGEGNHPHHPRPSWSLSGSRFRGGLVPRAPFDSSFPKR